MAWPRPPRRSRDRGGTTSWPAWAPRRFVCRKDLTPIFLWLPREARGPSGGGQGGWQREVWAKGRGCRVGPVCVCAAAQGSQGLSGQGRAQTQGWGGRGVTGCPPCPLSADALATHSSGTTATCTPPLHPWAPTQTHPCPHQARLWERRPPQGRFISRTAGFIKLRRNEGARGPPVTASQINERGRENGVCHLFHGHGAETRLTAPKPALGMTHLFRIYEQGQCAGHRSPSRICT